MLTVEWPLTSYEMTNGPNKRKHQKPDDVIFYQNKVLFFSKANFKIYMTVQNLRKPKIK